MTSKFMSNKSRRNDGWKYFQETKVAEMDLRTPRAERLRQRVEASDSKISK